MRSMALILMRNLFYILFFLLASYGHAQSYTTAYKLKTPPPKAAGCAPHLVLTGRHPDVQSQALPPVFPPQTQVHADLAAFVDQLLGDDASMTRN